MNLAGNECPNTDSVFTLAELAKRWKCSTRHLYNMINDGRLASFTIGDARRIRSDVVTSIEHAHAEDQEPEAA